MAHSDAKSAPIIGFSLDHEAGSESGYSKMPYYAIRENYLTCAERHGALTLPLPHNIGLVEAYLDRIDGLVVTGGNFDIPPSMFGEDSQHETVTLKETRTQSEWALCEGALKRGMPILGICGGQQLLTVVLGGTLIQHIPDSVPDCLAHEQPNPRTEAGHSVAITPDTLLHTIVGALEIPVNSAHHQAAATVGDGTRINAIAPDGVIEGIEYPDHPFCLGVQWHPEYDISPADEKIYAAFVAAAQNYQDKNSQ